MSVIEIAPKPGTRRATVTRDQPTRLSVDYQITTNSEFDGQQTVLAAVQASPLTPWFGRPYYVGNDLIFIPLESLDLTEDSTDPEMWHLTANFVKKEEDEDDDTDPSDDPLDAPYDISGSFSTETKAVEKAFYIHGFTDRTVGYFNLNSKNGVIPINSAGEPFVPGLTDVEYIETIRITGNYDKFPIGNIEFMNTPNKSTWTLTIDRPEYKRKFFTNTVKLVGMSYDYETKVVKTGPLTTREKTFVRITHILAFKRTGWDDEILDRGLNERRGPEDPDGLGGTNSPSLPKFAPIPGKTGTPIYLERIKSDGDDYPISTPVNLDGNGQRLGSGKDVESVYVTYRKRELMDYSKFKI